MVRRLKELSDRKQGLSRPTFQFSIAAIQRLTLFVALFILAVRELGAFFGPAAAAVVILAALSVLAHVAGALLGGRLRSGGDVPPDSRSKEELEPRLIQPLKAQLSDFAPTTQLSRQSDLARGPILYAIGTGAVSGAIIASIVLTWFMWDHLAIVNVLFGATSAAVIGGLLGFCVSSFYQVIRGALYEAQDET